MTVQERIIAIRLSEKINRQPAFANSIGVTASNGKKTAQNNKKR